MPEENLLYFLEKFSPKLKDWERELLRIVRNIAQYFCPQRQTKVMNEGCATYVHYKIMNRLYDLGKIGDGAMLEFLASHSSVVFQPDFDDQRYSGINPYALGFEMMCDIERVVTDPTEEDRAYLPQIAGCGDVMGVLKDAWANYRDDSFIAQFLSPHLTRQMCSSNWSTGPPPRTTAWAPFTTTVGTRRCGAPSPASTIPVCETQTSR